MPHRQGLLRLQFRCGRSGRSVRFLRNWAETEFAESGSPCPPPSPLR